jgi:hypothetical protein
MGEATASVEVNNTDVGNNVAFRSAPIPYNVTAAAELWQQWRN